MKPRMKDVTNNRTKATLPDEMKMIVSLELVFPCVGWPVSDVVGTKKSNIKNVPKKLWAFQ